MLNDKQFLGEVRKAVHSKKTTVVISPIVILEYGFYQKLHGKLHQFKKLMKELRIGIVNISAKDAFAAIKHSLLYKDDSRGPYYYFRDAMIAAQSERLKIPVITNNKQNFKGLPNKMKMTSKEIISSLE